MVIHIFWLKVPGFGWLDHDCGNPECMWRGGHGIRLGVFGLFWVGYPEGD